MNYHPSRAAIIHPLPGRFGTGTLLNEVKGWSYNNKSPTGNTRAGFRGPQIDCVAFKKFLFLTVWLPIRQFFFIATGPVLSSMVETEHAGQREPARTQSPMETPNFASIQAKAPMSVLHPGFKLSLRRTIQPYFVGSPSRISGYCQSSNRSPESPACEAVWRVLPMN